MAAAGDYRFNGGVQDQDYAGEYDYHDQGRRRRGRRVLPLSGPFHHNVDRVTDGLLWKKRAPRSRGRQVFCKAEPKTFNEENYFGGRGAEGGRGVERR